MHAIIIPRPKAKARDPEDVAEHPKKLATKCVSFQIPISRGELSFHGSPILPQRGKSHFSIIYFIIFVK